MSGDLQTSRYDQLIRRIGGIIGPGSKVTEALAELFPVIELENTVPELLALSGWRTAWQSTERPASANENVSELFNPAGSGVIAAVTSLMLASDVAGAIIQAQIIEGQIGGTPVAGLFRDSRFGVPRATTCTVEGVDGIPTGGGLRVVVGTDLVQIRDDNGIVVLTPGTGLQVGTVGTTIRLTVNYFWRERLAEPSELSFP